MKQFLCRRCVVLSEPLEGAKAFYFFILKKQLLPIFKLNLGLQLLSKFYKQIF